MDIVEHNDRMVVMGNKLNQLFKEYLSKYGVVLVTPNVKRKLIREWGRQGKLDDLEYNTKQLIEEFVDNHNGYLFARNVSFITIDLQKYYFVDYKKAAQFLSGIGGLFK